MALGNPEIFRIALCHAEIPALKRFFLAGVKSLNDFLNKVKPNNFYLRNYTSGGGLLPEKLITIVKLLKQLFCITSIVIGLSSN